MSFLLRTTGRALARTAQQVGAVRIGARTFVRPSHGSETYDKAYRLFDMDGDGEITPEELIQILTTVGESPGDLNLYFAGMNTGTISDYRAVVDWLTFLIRHVIKKDPKTAQADLIKEWKVYDTEDNTSMSADSLFDWIEYYYPEMTIEQIDHLVDGADIDGDGDINYVAYAELVCQKILNLNSKPLKSAFNEIDTDHNEELSVEEVSTLTGRDRATLEEQLAKIDLDNSGTINFIEFLYGIATTKGESYLMNAFREYDTDGSGLINPTELADWFSKHSTEEVDLENLISGADFNNDGKIDYEEFICMVVKKQI